MRLIVSAPSLSKPTYETLEEYSQKRFIKLEKFFGKNKDQEHEIRISVEKSGPEYELRAELILPELIYVKSKDRDIRKVVDIAFDEIKRSLNDRHKKINSKRKNMGVEFKRNKSLL